MNARRPQTSETHECPKDGCTMRVRREMFACRSHWFSLPPAVRAAIWAAYRDHGIGSPELFEAHAAAYTAWGDE